MNVHACMHVLCAWNRIVFDDRCNYILTWYDIGIVWIFIWDIYVYLFTNEKSRLNLCLGKILFSVWWRLLLFDYFVFFCTFYLFLSDSVPLRPSLHPLCQNMLHICYLAVRFSACSCSFRRSPFKNVTQMHDRPWW